MSNIKANLTHYAALADEASQLTNPGIFIDKLEDDYLVEAIECALDEMVNRVGFEPSNDFERSIIDVRAAFKNLADDFINNIADIRERARRR